MGALLGKLLLACSGLTFIFFIVTAVHLYDDDNYYERSCIVHRVADEGYWSVDGDGTPDYVEDYRAYITFTDEAKEDSHISISESYYNSFTSEEEKKVSVLKHDKEYLELYAVFSFIGFIGLALIGGYLYLKDI